ncbi:LptA/OstA family protein [Novosphingobium lentum]|uniref:LptA/OstA family protein n=1 Tax=Novosphingobium lentum TaxID=145287 RepID=UPI000832AB7A|nr:LptA/OstA family protein [Novosphingobium lentum]
MSSSSPSRPSLSRPSLSRVAVRSLVAGFLAGGIVVFGFNPFAAAQAIPGFNSNAPVNYAADRIELQDKQNRVVLSGNVDISQGELKLRAARTTVAYTNAGSLKIQRIDATGGVFVSRPGENASGDVAVYDFNRRVITMLGNVALRRGSDNLNGGRLVIDLDSGISSVDGRAGGSSSAVGGGVVGTTSGGRVSGTFSVPKRN